MWWLAIPILLLLAGARGGNASTTPRRAMKPAPVPPAYVALAAKWGKIFGVPPKAVLAIMRNETEGTRPNPYNPDYVNTDAIKGMGAWGLMQVLYTTAAGRTGRSGLVEVLKKSSYAKDPDVVSALQLWNEGAKPSDLTDPNLNVMLGTYYLSGFLKKYKKLDLAAAAYNAGPRDLDKHLAENGSLGNFDAKYVSDFMRTYEGRA